jgi:hypothetical protein
VRKFKTNFKESLRKFQLAFSKFSPRIFPMTHSRYFVHYYLMTNITEFKFAFLINENRHLEFNATFGKSLITMTGEKVTKSLALSMRRNNMVFGLLSETVNRLIPSGILQHLSDYAKWFFARKLIEDQPSSLIVLSLHNLEYGFVIWLCSCAVAVFVFFCEFMPVKVKQMVISLIGLCCFMRLLFMRMRVYHN